jgi:hypothetical protein
MTKSNTSTAAKNADERTRRDNAPQVRGDFSARQDAERTTKTGLTSTDDFDQFLRDEFDQVALPSPPKTPGYHFCWMTTTSSYDSIAKRQRLGYEAVRRSELPGFDPSNGKDLAQFEGFVTCNEMVLHKIPEDRYQSIMRYFHSTRPAEDTQSILSKIAEGNSSRRDSNGQALGSVEGDGIHSLAQTEAAVARNGAPTFA